MIIAMEQGMDALQTLLKEAGHVVVPLFGYKGAVDAVVYKEINILEASSGLQNFASEDRGVLMICARHMSDTEIFKALETKCFSQIF
ncbi:MAG: YkuS family protein [Clostridia bacterium]|nr:YkuS family protein [Clostridia bacterium]